MANTYTIPNTGDTLNNGATVIDAKPCNAPHLCKVVCSFGSEFVTWTMNLQTGGCFGGGYFSNVSDAVKDFSRN